MSRQPSGLAVLEEYFEALDEGDFETASRCFADDVVYLHPPMYGDEIRIEGRAALYEYFTEVRGVNDFVHHVDRGFEEDGRCAAVGHVTEGDETPLEHFVSYAEVHGGEITYYVAGLLGASDLTS